MTYRFAYSDIEKLLQQTISQRKFSPYQILFWILCIADRLKSQHILKIESGAFVHQYAQLQVLIDSITGRQYIELPTGIYDFDRDGGVAYLSYDYTIDPCSPTFTSVQFTRTQPSKTERLYWTDEEKPQPDNPYFYRISDKIYLLGTECIPLTFLEGGFYSTFDPATVCDLDTEFDFPQELYPILRLQILDLAKFGLQVPNNRTNTGNYNLDEQLEAVPKQKLTSVNQQENDNQ